MASSPIANGSCSNIADDMLKEAGLDQYPIDASSRSALNEIVSSFIKNENMELVLERLDGTNSSQTGLSDTPPIQQITSINNTLFDRLISDVSDWNPINPSTTNPNEEDLFTENLQEMGSNVSAGGSSRHQNQILGITEKMSPVQQAILDQMEQQTKMILLLHERMDQLTNNVNRLGEIAMRGENSLSMQIPYAPKGLQQNHSKARIEMPVSPTLTSQTQQQHQRVDLSATEREAIRPPPQMFIFALFSQFFQFVQTLPETVRASKFGKIVRLFLALYARQVRVFDVGLAIKVLFMIAIFMTRIQRRLTSNATKNENNLFFSSWSFWGKFTVVSFLILTGFLVQNGFFRFLYSFFVKNNYPRRIFEGEDLEIERVLEEEATQRVQAAVGQNINNRNNHNNERGRQQQPDGRGVGELPFGGFNIRHTLLGGGIAPIGNNNDPPEPRMRPFPFVLRFLHDLMIFIASFFLSMFPMWRPVAAPREQVAVQPGPEAEPLQPPHDGNQHGIPEVQPPVDPVEEEDEDE